MPGLLAKPIIDIVLALADSSDETAYVPALELAGYVLRIRTPDWHRHRMLTTPAADANLHVFSAGSSEIDRMLAFRDRLRDDAPDGERYAAAKRALARRRWRYLQHYADAKTNIIEDILRNGPPG